MDQDNYQWARPYLRDGEKILWCGKPAKPHVFEKDDLHFFAVGFIAACLVLFHGLIPAIQSEPFGFSWIVPIITFLGGLYFSFGHLLQKAVVLRNSFYVVTTDRILIRIQGKVHVYSKANLPPISVIRYSDGEGSIILQHPQSTDPRTKAYPMFADLRNAIHSIPDVDAATHAIETQAD